MSFFENEFLRKIGFRRTGGPTFNTAVVVTQSGQEQRNRAWQNPRAQYEALAMMTSDSSEARLAFIDSVRTFFFLVGGMADGFRFYDELDFHAVNEPLVLVSGSTYQLQRTYTLNGRSYVRSITKPITSAVKDFSGNAMADSVSIVSGGTLVSVDHTKGQVVLSGVSGTPHATFDYHIPVRFNSDKFEPEIEESGPGARLIKWNSLGLIEVRPPNY